MDYWGILCLRSPPRNGNTRDESRHRDVAQDGVGKLGDAKREFFAPSMGSATPGGGGGGRRAEAVGKSQAGEGREQGIKQGIKSRE